jgi:FKBP-type peptidyl-prolyl cis-trans isomerase 2
MTSHLLQNGDALEVDYIGRLEDNGVQFDTNFGQGPYKFVLGTGQVGILLVD